MRRLLYLAFVLLLACPVALSQSTTVSGTITDTSSQNWNFGTYSFTFQPVVGNFGPYVWNGSPFNVNQTISGNLSNLGAFSVSVPSNTSITPAGSVWIFQVCPAATSPCFRVPLTITGATQSVTGNVVPPAITVNLTNPPAGAAAYSDAQIIGAKPGSFYFNLTDNTLHSCAQTGFPPCTWVAASSAALLPLNNTWTGTNNFTNGATFSTVTNGSCVQGGAGGSLTSVVPVPCAGPASSISAESTSPYASPSASAATNTTAINNALSNTGTVTLTKCGTYNITGNLILSSNTRLNVAPCVTIVQTAVGSDFVENHAFANRGALVTTGSVTYNSSGSTLAGCTNGTQTVTFNNNGGAQQAQGTVTVTGATGPTNGAAVTIIQAGGMYTAAPTTGTVTSCTGTANFNGTSIVGAATAVTIAYTSPNTTATVTWTSWLTAVCPSCSSTSQAVGLPVYLAGVATAPFNVPSSFSGVFSIGTPVTTNTFTITLDHLPGSSFSGTVYAIPADYNIIVDGGQWNYNFPTNNISNDLKANAFNFGAVQSTYAQNLVVTNVEKYAVFLSSARNSRTINIGAPTTNSDIVKLECSLKNVAAINTWGSNADDGVSWMNWGGGFYDAWCAGDVQNVGIDGVDVNTTGGTALAVAYFSAPYYTAGTFIRNVFGKSNGYGAVAYGYQSTAPVLNDIEIDNVPAGNGSVAQVGTLGTCAGGPGTCPYTINSFKLFNIPFNSTGGPLFQSDSNAVFNSFFMDSFAATNTSYGSGGFAAVVTADGIYNNCEIADGIINIGANGYFWQFANSGSLQAVTNCTFHNVRMVAGKALMELAGGIASPPVIALRDSFLNSTIGLDIRSNASIFFAGDTFGSSVTSGSVNTQNNINVTLDNAGGTTWAVAGQNGVWQVASGTLTISSKTPCNFQGFGPTVSGFSASSSTPNQNVCTGFLQTGATPSLTGTLTFPFTATNAWECDLHLFNASGANFPSILVETGNSQTSYTTQHSSFAATGITANSPSAGQATIAGAFGGINGAATSIVVSGFTNGGNNGANFTVLSLSPTSVVVTNGSAVTETHAATVTSNFPLSNIYVYRCSQR